MAIVYPSLENIERLKVAPTDGEWQLVNYLHQNLDGTFEVFFNPFLDGDRPDIIILKENAAAHVIEVKDWNLNNFELSDKNEWKLSVDGKSVHKASPHSQAFRYKKNLYDLHLPVVGLKRLINPNFFNLVHCFVYFHGSDKNSIHCLYSAAEERILRDRDELNERRKKNEITDQQKYDKSYDYLSRKIKNVVRDRSISFGDDQLEQLKKKIVQKSNRVLFDKDIYEDFKRRLKPSDHVLRQGRPIAFNNVQLPLTISKPGFEKIKGVAGCGKTSILAQRAVSAYQRHGSPILILTFNITLKNLIRDRVSDIQGCRNFEGIEITNYHQFFNSQVTNSGLEMSELIAEHGLVGLYLNNIFKNEVIDKYKYKTILIDEVQDYRKEWLQIVKDEFLLEDGEMVLFGDDLQNLYGVEETGKTTQTMRGFGAWQHLKRSYRSGFDSALNGLFKRFQLKYLASKYAEMAILEVNPVQDSINFDEVLEYRLFPSEDWPQNMFDSIHHEIKRLEINPNDMVILSSQISSLRKLSRLFSANEKVHCMFETDEEITRLAGTSDETIVQLNDEEYESIISSNCTEIEKIRRVKKNHFYSNSGLIKFSTVHSFKGLESKYVFFIMHENDSPEVVYTAITRSFANLVICDVSNKSEYSGFFRKELNAVHSANAISEVV